MLTRSRCDRCDGRAIVIDAEGKWRCVVCTPKKFTYNEETMNYE